MHQQNQKTEINLLVNYFFVNGSNDGSYLSNKEFHLCYCIINTDIVKSKMKKIIGCFINPNDLYLENSKINSSLIETYLYYFQMYITLDRVFNITDLLKKTLYSKSYSNYTTKKILKENKDSSIKKIITKCEETIKNKILI